MNYSVTSAIFQNSRLSGGRKLLLCARLVTVTMKTLSIFGLASLLFATAFVYPSAAQSNSSVRFLVRYGTNTLGNVDVELFDSQKPVTVSNFLYYAQSGAYSNTILHDCTVNFAVVGGYGTVANPSSVADFTVLNRIQTGAAITNESAVGQYYGNVFGTLGMALDRNPLNPTNSLPNSATSPWFFNLGNNTAALDGQGFTVFGRITTSEGTNTLQYFNTLAALNRIITTTNPACSAVRLSPTDQNVILDQLPVGPFLRSSTCAQIKDLFNVQVLMVNAPDLVGPSLVVSNPAANLIITNGTLIVSGAAYDNFAVSNVVVELNGGAAIEVATTNGTWSTTLTNLPGGTNVIVVRAQDTSSNFTEVTRRIFHRVKVPLDLTIVGSGTVSGASDGDLLEVGRNYTLTAKPAKNNLFADWSGSVSTLTPKLTFEMDTNVTLTATFGTNLFPAVQGTYNGLFSDTNDFQQASAGFVTIKVGKTGTSSGKVLLNGGSHSVKGSLNAFGLGSFLVARKGTNALQLNLSLDLTNGTDQLIGTVSEVTSNSSTIWTAQLLTDRAYFDGKLNVATQAGKYTIVLPADTNSAAGPEGDSFGAVTLSTKGAVSLSGTLADGTKVTQKTSISKNGDWPLYVPLYKGKGALISWVNFTNQPDSDVIGAFNWFKQTQTAKYYGGGFTNEALLVGSTFVASKTNNVLSWSNALVAFLGGNLSADFTNAIGIDAKNKVTNLGTNKLSLSLNKSSGTFKGSVTSPTGGKALSFSGAVLQNQTNGSGFLLGTNRSSRVVISPE